MERLTRVVLVVVLFALPACAIKSHAPASAVTSGVSDRSFVEPLTGLRFVLVPGGSFSMGSQFAESQPETVRRWFMDEAPARRVLISHNFWLASTETTVAAFRRFVNETGYVTSAERSGQSLGAYQITTDQNGVQSGQWVMGSDLSWQKPGWIMDDNHPVTHVSWQDAAAFVQWLRDKTGAPFRLPTEAEWEYAAGGSNHSVYSWGNDEPTAGNEGNIADLRFSEAYPQWKYPVLRAVDDRYAHTAPVGSYVPNDFGLYDMTGNVWEWCADRYSATYYTIAPDTDPKGADDGAERVHRGGGFDWELPYLRVAKRRRGEEHLAAANIGFRLALSPGSSYELKYSQTILERTTLTQEARRP